MTLISDADISNKNFNKTENEKIPIRLYCVEKREIDCSRLNSFKEPFQLFHADITNLEFLGKLATPPRYALLAVDLHSSK